MITIMAMIKLSIYKIFIRILSIEQFKNLMSDFSTINEFGDNIIQKMFNYYDEKLKTIKQK